MAWINLKAGLVVAAKNAVNAALTTAGPMALWPSFFQVHTLMGLAHVASLLGTSILAREVVVWGPKLLKWSSRDSGGQGQ